jgi:hypothetical protein
MTQQRPSGPVDRLVRRFRDWLFVKRWGCLPPKPFRTHGLASWWYDNGCPSKFGTLVREKMQSGRVAVFRLVNVERAWNCDWSWYDFEFVRYEVEPPPDGAARPYETGAR